MPPRDDVPFDSEPRVVNDRDAAPPRALPEPLLRLPARALLVLLRALLPPSDEREDEPPLRDEPPEALLPERDEELPPREEPPELRPPEPPDRDDPDDAPPERDEPDDEPLREEAPPERDAEPDARELPDAEARVEPDARLDVERLDAAPEREDAAPLRADDPDVRLPPDAERPEAEPAPVLRDDALRVDEPERAVPEALRDLVAAPRVEPDALRDEAPVLRADVEREDAPPRDEADFDADFDEDPRVDEEPPRDDVERPELLVAIVLSVWLKDSRCIKKACRKCNPFIYNA